MVSRTRTQAPVTTGSSRLKIAGSWSSLAPLSFCEKSDTCTDEVAPGDGHPLAVDHGIFDGVTPVNYVVPSGTFAGSTFINWIPSIFSFTGGPTTWPITKSEFSVPPYNRPSNGALAAQLVARTSPSRPVVDLPIFIWELRELPDLFKKFGDRLHKQLADANLRYQFGIRPLVADLTSLLNFQGAVSSRYHELKALQSGGLKRKLKLHSDTQRYTRHPNLLMNSGYQMPTIRGIVNLDVQNECWGFIKWYPTTNFPKTDSALRSLAMKAVLGLTVDFSTAWNAMPWSWLVDWCSSVGDYLIASRNIVPATHSTPLIMEHRKLVHEIQVSSISGGVIPHGMISKSYRIERELKSRAAASASLSAHIPLLSKRQLSILGSIATKRYR